MRKALRFLVLAVPALFALAGCATRAQTGALIGGAAGAGAGYLIGHEMDH